MISITGHAKKALEIITFIGQDAYKMYINTFALVAY